MDYRNPKAKGIKINSQKVGVIEHLGLTRVSMHQMELGVGSLNTCERIRMVRWRWHGVCRYILIGKRRGKVIEVARNFKRIRPITDSERDRILGDIELRKILGI